MIGIGRKHRMTLVWSERERDYVERTSGVTLTALMLAAKAHGYRFKFTYPEGRKARWGWFEIVKPAGHNREEEHGRSSKTSSS